VSTPLSYLRVYFDAPKDDPTICDSNVGLGRKDNMFDVLGGSVGHFRSEVTLVGRMTPLTHIPYTWWTSRGKSYGTLSWISLFIFLCLFFFREGTNFPSCDYFSALLLPCL